jgi:hypothetical protein
MQDSPLQAEWLLHAKSKKLFFPHSLILFSVSSHYICIQHSPTGLSSRSMLVFSVKCELGMYRCTAYMYNVGQLWSSPRKNGFDLGQFQVRFVTDNMALGHVFIEFGFLLWESFYPSSILISTFKFLSSWSKRVKPGKLHTTQFFSENRKYWKEMYF